MIFFKENAMKPTKRTLPRSAGVLMLATALGLLASGAAFAAASVTLTNTLYGPGGQATSPALAPGVNSYYLIAYSFTSTGTNNYLQDVVPSCLQVLSSSSNPYDGNPSIILGNTVTWHVEDAPAGTTVSGYVKVSVVAMSCASASQVCDTVTYSTTGSSGPWTSTTASQSCILTVATTPTPTPADPGLLTIQSFTASSNTATSQQHITFQMTAFNNATFTVEVSPNIGFLNGASPYLISGPSPANAAVSAGSSSSFSWVYLLGPCGDTGFSVSASAPLADGLGTSNTLTTTVQVLCSPTVTASPSITPSITPTMTYAGPSASGSPTFTVAIATYTLTDTPSPGSPTDVPSTAPTSSATTTPTIALSQMPTLTPTLNGLTPTTTPTRSATVTSILIQAQANVRCRRGSLTAFPNLIKDPSGQSRITFFSCRGGNATLRIVRGNGRAVLTLWQGSLQPQQSQSMAWDGRDAGGNLVPSGVYYVIFIDGDGTHEIQRILIIR